MYYSLSVLVISSIVPLRFQISSAFSNIGAFSIVENDNPNRLINYRTDHPSYLTWFSSSDKVE